MKGLINGVLKAIGYIMIGILAVYLLIFITGWF